MPVGVRHRESLLADRASIGMPKRRPAPPTIPETTPVPDPALVNSRARKPKRLSRAARWSAAAAKASEAKDLLEAALSDLRDIQSEYSDWKDNLPENLSNTPLGEKLEAVCDLDLELDLSVLEEAESIELPQGWGRD